MVRYNPWKLNDEQRKKLLAVFYKSVTMVDDYDEAKSFLKDLLTVKEIAMLARRLQIATLIISGYTYREIKSYLKTSYATIANIQKWLNVGGKGYRSIIKKLIEHEKKLFKEKTKSKWEKFDIKKVYTSYYWPEKLLEFIRQQEQKRRKRKSINE